MLILTRYDGEAIILRVAGVDIRVMVERHPSRVNQTKVLIDAPRSVEIIREELLTDWTSEKEKS